jgi:hypothetical protein
VDEESSDTDRFGSYRDPAQRIDYEGFAESRPLDTDVDSQPGQDDDGLVVLASATQESAGSHRGSDASSGQSVVADYWAIHIRVFVTHDIDA